MWPELLQGVFGIIDRVLPDPQAAAAAKLEAMKLQASQEGQQLEASVRLALGQLNVDQAEASSSDPLQHWRGGLGWVCVAGYSIEFVICPLANMIAKAVGHPLDFPGLDMSVLSTLTLGMLGLGGLHVTERIKGAA